MVKKILLTTTSLLVIFSLVYSAPPTITSVSPSSGNRGQTLDVIIIGSNLASARSVSFGPDVCIKVNSFSPMLGPRYSAGTRLKVNITIYETAQLGPKDVTVTTPEGTATGKKLFTVAGLPSIRSVSPSRGATGGAVDVTIIGEGFYGLTSVSFGAGITVGTPTVVSEYVPTMIKTTLSISASTDPGPRDVVVTTNHGTATGRGLFEVIPLMYKPAVSSVFPSSGLVGQTMNVTIRGANLSGATAVSFGAGITVNSFRVMSSTQIDANITISRTATQGLRDISVTTPRGTAVGRGLFRVTVLG